MRRLPKELFSGTAGYYARYRPAYPPALFQHIARTFKLDGTGRLLDLGCGTGELTLPFARYFCKVIGVDPEKGMIIEARRNARRARVQNTEWISGKAEDVVSRMMDIRLVTMGRSFHWMDRRLVLHQLGKIVEPNGGIVVVTERGAENVPKWRNAMQGVIERHLGKRRRAGCGFYMRTKGRHEDTLTRSAFARVTIWRYRLRHVWTVRSILGYLYSTSYSSRNMFSSKVRAFERDMRKALLETNPAGKFRETIFMEALIARRPRRR